MGASGSSKTKQLNWLDTRKVEIRGPCHRGMMIYDYDTKKFAILAMNTFCCRANDMFFEDGRMCRFRNEANTWQRKFVITRHRKPNKELWTLDRAITRAVRPEQNPAPKKKNSSRFTTCPATVDLAPIENKTLTSVTGQKVGQPLKANSGKFSKAGSFGSSTLDSLGELAGSGPCAEPPSQNHIRKFDTLTPIAESEAPNSDTSAQPVSRAKTPPSSPVRRLKSSGLPCPNEVHHPKITRSKSADVLLPSMAPETAAGEKSETLSADGAEKEIVRPQKMRSNTSGKSSEDDLAMSSVGHRLERTLKVENKNILHSRDKVSSWSCSDSYVSRVITPAKFNPCLKVEGTLVRQNSLVDVIPTENGIMGGIKLPLPPEPKRSWCSCVTPQAEEHSCLLEWRWKTKRFANVDNPRDKHTVNMLKVMYGGRIITNNPNGMSKKTRAVKLLAAEVDFCQIELIVNRDKLKVSCEAFKGNQGMDLEPQEEGVLIPMDGSPWTLVFNSAIFKATVEGHGPHQIYATVETFPSSLCSPQDAICFGSMLVGHLSPASFVICWRFRLHLNYGLWEKEVQIGQHPMAGTSKDTHPAVVKKRAFLYRMKSSSVRVAPKPDVNEDQLADIEIPILQSDPGVRRRLPEVHQSPQEPASIADMLKSL